MTTLRYDQAAPAALVTELHAGRQLVVLRLGSAVNGDGVLADDLAGQLGAGRVRYADLPLAALIATATGAALSGVRPVIELHTDSGSGAGNDALSWGWTVESLAGALIAAQALTAGASPGLAAGAAPGAGGGAAGGPGTAGPGTPPSPTDRSSAMTVRVIGGSGTGPAATASSAVLASLLGVPGTTVVLPATAADSYGLMRAALREAGHVVVLEPQALAAGIDEVPDGAAPLPLTKAAVLRSGDRLTLVAAGGMRQIALSAAAILAGAAIEAEVIDPRCLSPFDDETIAASLGRTARLVVVQDGPLAASWAAPLVARLASAHFGLFDAPPRLVGPGDGRIPAVPAPVTADALAAAAAEVAIY